MIATTGDQRTFPRFVASIIAVLPEIPRLRAGFDLAVIRLAAGKRAEALQALRKALALNPKLKVQAERDKDLDAARDEVRKLLSSY
jgi:hypothetical protein